jgi:hypothetical protein
VRGSSESKQPHSLSLLHSSYAQTAKADDARAEQRCRVQIVERGRQRVYKIGAGQGVFRVTSSNGISRKRWRIAEILEAAPAILTRAIRPAEPGNSDPRILRNIFRTAEYNRADNLMTGNHPRLFRRQFAFDDVEVGTADAARAHSQKNLAHHGMRVRDISDS